MEKLPSRARNTHDIDQVLLWYQNNQQDHGTLDGEEYSLNDVVQNRCLYETF
jgi:predicted CoA-binding protein